MNCPKCGGSTKVVDSRTNCESTRRTRKCHDCGYTYPTVELEVDLAENLDLIPKANPLKRAIKQLKGDHDNG